MSRRLGIVIFVGVVLVWLPSVSGGFVWDDLDNLLYSDRLKHWSSLWECFLHDAMWSANKEQATIGTYRPLALASFVLDMKIFGVDAGWMHFTSVLWHGLAAWLVYRLFARWTTPEVGFGLAFLWAVHPAAAEAVAWVNGRSEVFALIGGVGAAVVASHPRLGPGRLLAMFTLILVALFGKETGVLFVPVAVWLAGEANGRAGAGPLWKIWQRVHWPAALTAGAAVAVYFVLRGRALAGGPVAGLVENSTEQAITAFPAIALKSLQVAVFPFELSLNHLRIWVRDASPWWTWIGLAVLAAQALAFGVLWWRGRRPGALALSWWVASLIPVALIGVIGWPGMHRWLYLGLPGLIWAGHALLEPVFRGRPTLTLAAFTVLATASTVQTQRAIRVWHDGEQLFGAMVYDHPTVSYGYIGLGAWQLEHHQYEKAEATLRQAVSLDVRRADGHYFLSRTLCAQGRCEDALAAVADRTARDALAPGVAWAVGKCFADKRNDPIAAREFYVQCETDYTDCSAGIAAADALLALEAKPVLPAPDGARMMPASVMPATLMVPASAAPE